MEMPFRGDPGVPKGSHPVPGEAGAAWRAEVQEPKDIAWLLVRGGHTCLELLLSDGEQCDWETFRGTSKVNRTHGCSQLLKKLSMILCVNYIK